MRERGTKGTRNIFSEITADNFPNLGRDMDIHIKQAFVTQLLQDSLYLNFQK
jgi:hypothetical protein